MLQSRGDYSAQLFSILRVRLAYEHRHTRDPRSYFPSQNETGMLNIGVFPNRGHLLRIVWDQF
jgi:hypothetical protein